MELVICEECGEMDNLVYVTGVIRKVLCRDCFYKWAEKLAK